MRPLRQTIAEGMGSKVILNKVAFSFSGRREEEGVHIKQQKERKRKKKNENLAARAKRRTLVLLVRGKTPEPWGKKRRGADYDVSLKEKARAT